MDGRAACVETEEAGVDVIVRLPRSPVADAVLGAAESRNCKEGNVPAQAHVQVSDSVLGNDAGRDTLLPLGSTDKNEERSSVRTCCSPNMERFNPGSSSSPPPLDFSKGTPQLCGQDHLHTCPIHFCSPLTPRAQHVPAASEVPRSALKKPQQESQEKQKTRTSSPLPVAEHTERTRPDTKERNRHTELPRPQLLPVAISRPPRACAPESDLQYRDMGSHIPPDGVLDAVKVQSEAEAAHIAACHIFREKQHAVCSTVASLAAARANVLANDLAELRAPTHVRQQVHATSRRIMEEERIAQERKINAVKAAKEARANVVTAAKVRATTVTALSSVLCQQEILRAAGIAASEEQRQQQQKCSGIQKYPKKYPIPCEEVATEASSAAAHSLEAWDQCKENVVSDCLNIQGSPPKRSHVEFKHQETLMSTSSEQAGTTSTSRVLSIAARQPIHSIGFDSRCLTPKALLRQRQAARNAQNPLLRLRNEQEAHSMQRGRPCAQSSVYRADCMSLTPSVMCQGLLEWSSASTMPPHTQPVTKHPALSATTSLASLRDTVFLGSIGGAFAENGPAVPAGAGWPPVRPSSQDGQLLNDPCYYTMGRRLLTARRRQVVRDGGHNTSAFVRKPSCSLHSKFPVPNIPLGDGAGGSETKWVGGSLSRPHSVQGSAPSRRLRRQWTTEGTGGTRAAEPRWVQHGSTAMERTRHSSHRLPNRHPDSGNSAMFGVDSNYINELAKRALVKRLSRKERLELEMQR